MTLCTVWHALFDYCWFILICSLRSTYDSFLLHLDFADLFLCKLMKRKGKKRWHSPCSKCKPSSELLGPQLVIQFMPDGSRSHDIFFFLFESWKSQTQECSYKFVKFKFHVKREEGKKDQDKVRSLQLLSHSCSASSASYGFLRIFFFLLFLLYRGRIEPWMQALQSVIRLTSEASMPPDWAQLWGHGWNLQVPGLLYRCVLCMCLCACKRVCIVQYQPSEHMERL